MIASPSQREQWPPTSPTANRRRPHIRLPGAPGHFPAQSQPVEGRSLPGFQFISTLTSLRQHARLPSEVSLNNRATERSALWSASKAMDTGLHSNPRAYRKRVRAEDLWDRDEEELLQRRRAKELASSVSLAEVGEKESQPESVGSSELPQYLHSFGSAAEDLLHSELTDSREEVSTRPEADDHSEVDIPTCSPESQNNERDYTRTQDDALHHSEDDIPACSPESQSNERSYTWPQADALNYAEDEIPSRSAESQSRPDLKRSRDRYLDDFETEKHAELKSQKRRRNSAGYTEPLRIGKYLPYKPSQDELVDELLKKLANEQGKTRAAKQELKRLQDHNKTWEPNKRKKGKKYAAVTKREKDQAGRTHQTALSTDTTSVRQEFEDTGRLASLPDNVKDVIFGMLLESPHPIKLDTASLMDFVYTSVNVPSATSSEIGRRRTKLLFRPPRELNPELQKMKADLHKISPDKWPSRSVVSGLALSLLSVSKAVHRRAARCFYSNNVFEFSHSRDAWLHLASFLATIGPINAGSIQHLSVAVPKWHPDTSHDRLSAAILDGLSPLTRLMAPATAAKDPLISAISKCAYVLAAQTGLVSFQMDMQMNDVQQFLNHGVNASMYNLSNVEKKAHTKRKDVGAQMLLGLSRRVLSSGCQPELVIHAGGSDNKQKFAVARLLPSIEATAKKYGWDLNHTLKVSDNPESDQPEANDKIEAQEEEWIERDL